MGLLKRAGIRLILALPASGMIEGYENPDLIEFVFQNSRRRMPPAAPWPEIVGAKSVLDFGGAFGTHYHRAAAQDLTIRWAIVETEAMVARAAELATEHLQFFTTIDAAQHWLGSIDIVHSSGALQYTPDPIGTVRALQSLGAPAMLWDRIDLSESEIEHDTQVALLAQNGPNFHFSRKRVKYHLTRIPEREFIAAHTRYELSRRAGSAFTFRFITA